MSRWFFLPLAAVASVALVATRPSHRALPYYVEPSLTPQWFLDPSRSAIHEIGDFSLTDQDGAHISRRTVEGHIYVASFFYSSCRTLCPEIRDQLTRVRDAFNGDANVMILSHSVLPESDSVGQLAHYARLNQVGHGQWRRPVSRRAELERLARERYFVELTDTTGSTKGRLRHTETLVLVDGRGHIRGVYDGSLPFEVTQLIEDIRTLRDEGAYSPITGNPPTFTTIN